MIIIFPYILMKNVRGMALFPFILLRQKNDKHNKVLIFHEKIHLRQQLEMLILPFYIWYIIEFLIHLVILKNLHSAYLSISFEKEAYHNQHNLNYLNERKFWDFLHYIRFKNTLN